MRLGAAILSDILYLLGQRNFIFIREKSGNFEK